MGESATGGPGRAAAGAATCECDPGQVERRDDLRVHRYHLVTIWLITGKFGKLSARRWGAEQVGRPARVPATSRFTQALKVLTLH
ncbi:hypothetical protein CLOP_g12078 [Closterium sp. NIES-67]|nr:hypothetical protein CLOP_g12078 [Closterium sp. NIES-67]